MFSLEKLRDRLKGSRIIKMERSEKYPLERERLYLRYGQNDRNIKTTTFFEIVNDRIQLFVTVENLRNENRFNYEKASKVREDLLNQLHEVINECEMERRKVPLHERLKDDVVPVYTNSLLHQAQSLRFFCMMKVGCLPADVGIGKSKIAIDLATSRYHAGQIDKVVLFCPVSTKRNFSDELKKWGSAPGIYWQIVGIETMSNSTTTYLQVLAGIDSRTMIIVDECHFCKTPFSNRSFRIKNCCDRTSYKLIMTGTLTEDVKDLFMQYALLSDLITGCKSWLKFAEKFLIMGGVMGDEVIGYKNLDYLMSLIEPYTYQIRKEDCLNLPAKQECELTCELNDRQVELYEETRMHLMDTLDKFDEYIPPNIFFEHFCIMQQICCGFYRHPKTGEIENIGNNKTALIEKTGYNNGQTIFFCKYLWEVDWLINWLGKDNCVRFTGQNRLQRDDLKRLFTNKEKQYFVATMSSGGVGLNGLQGCGRIVFVSNSFKWSERKQCIGRIDRKGQVNEMQVWDTVTKTGMDYRISRNLARKGNLADEIKRLLNDKTKLKQFVNNLAYENTAVPG